MPSEQFSISLSSSGSEARRTNIIGTRLQDQTGADFVVFNLPWKLLSTPDVAGETLMAFNAFDFPYVFAIRRTGRWIYVGKESLKAICESRLGQKPNWQEISALPRSPI